MNKTIWRNVLTKLFLLKITLIFTSLGFAQKPNNIFADKVVVAPHISVESSILFQVWTEGAIEQTDKDYDRTRLGTIVFSSNFRVHIDALKNKIHFPSYYELVEVKSKKTLIKLDIFDMNSAEWYFSGNGTAYLFQQDTHLCGPWKTRKIIKSGLNLVEILQPITYLGYETEVLSTTPLYESLNNRNVVATVTPQSKVTVLGVTSWKKSALGSAFLVKTSFGLTGWHIPQENQADGVLTIYMCN